MTSNVVKSSTPHRFSGDNHPQSLEADGLPHSLSCHWIAKDDPSFTEWWSYRWQIKRNLCIDACVLNTYNAKEHIFKNCMSMNVNDFFFKENSSSRSGLEGTPILSMGKVLQSKSLFSIWREWTTLDRGLLSSSITWDNKTIDNIVKNLE